MGCGTSKESIVSSDGVARCSRKLCRRKSSVAHQPSTRSSKDNADGGGVVKDGGARLPVVKEKAVVARRAKNEGSAVTAAGVVGNGGSKVPASVNVVVEKERGGYVKKEKEDHEVVPVVAMVVGERKDQDEVDKEIVADQNDGVASDVVVEKEEDVIINNGAAADVGAAIVEEKRDDDDYEEVSSAEVNVDGEDEDGSVTFLDGTVATEDETESIGGGDAPVTDQGGNVTSSAAAPVVTEDEDIATQDEIDTVVDAPVATDDQNATVVDAPVATEDQNVTVVDAPVATEDEIDTVVDAPVASEDQGAIVVDAPAATEDQSVTSVDDTEVEDNGVTSPTIKVDELETSPVTEDDDSLTLAAAPVTIDDQIPTFPATPATREKEEVKMAAEQPPKPSEDNDSRIDQELPVVDGAGEDEAEESKEVIAVEDDVNADSGGETSDVLQDTESLKEASFTGEEKDAVPAADESNDSEERLAAAALMKFPLN